MAKCIIAGSRDIKDYDVVSSALTLVFKTKEFSDVDTIISGEAVGVDSIGELYASNNNLFLLKVPAQKWEWDKFGRSAGYKRNIRMSELADCAIVIHNNTPGSLAMIKIMKKQSKLVKDIEYRKVLEWYQLQRGMEQKNPLM